MEGKVLSKILAEFPWLWAVHHAWSAENVEVTVKTVDKRAFPEELKRSWPRVQSGELKVFVHVRVGGTIKKGGAERVFEVGPKMGEDLVHAILRPIECFGYYNADFLLFYFFDSRNKRMVEICRLPRGYESFNEFLLPPKNREKLGIIIPSSK